MKLGGNEPLRKLAVGYTALIRGTPVLLQLFLIFYGVPPLLALAGVDINGWSKTTFAIITFTLNNAAYLSEDMRAAYRSVDTGQLEAALSVGMGRGTALFRILIPQAVTVFIPNLGNSVAALLKDTSIVFTIGVFDLMGKAKLVSAQSFGSKQLEIYIAVSLIYWVCVILIDAAMAQFEKRHARGSRGLRHGL
jgi:L-cystine transport system permease protein